MVVDSVTVVNVAQAKAHLSRLLDAAVAGEQIVLARNGKPLARLVPIEAPVERELGILDIAMPDERFAPLSGDELSDWS